MQKWEGRGQGGGQRKGGREVVGEEGGPGAEQGGGQGAGRQGQEVQKQQETGAEGRKSGGGGK